jgi:hypothetical protein
MGIILSQLCPSLLFFLGFFRFTHYASLLSSDFFYIKEWINIPFNKRGRLRSGTVGWGTVEGLVFDSWWSHWDFHWFNPSGRIDTGVDSVFNTCVPGVSPGGKGGRRLGLTTSPPSCADCLDIQGASNTWKLKACPGLYWNSFTCNEHSLTGHSTLCSIFYIREGYVSSLRKKYSILFRLWIFHVAYFWTQICRICIRKKRIFT